MSIYLPDTWCVVHTLPTGFGVFEKNTLKNLYFETDLILYLKLGSAA